MNIIPMDKRVGGWMVTGIGVALAGLSIWYVLIVRSYNLSNTAGIWGTFLQGLEILLLGTFSLVLVYAGYWLASSQFETNRVWWASLWTIIGLTGITTIVTLANSLQFIHGQELPEPTIIQTMLLAAGGGAFAGLLVGVSTLRETTAAEQARRRLDSLEFINELLRHNVLNGMQIIQMHSELLEEEVDEEGEEHLTLIQERADSIVELVDNVRKLMESISEEHRLEPVNLTRILRRSVSKASDTYQTAKFETEMPESCMVRADQLLGTVFDNILSNAVDHNDADIPRVSVRVRGEDDTAIVAVEDNGPGIPESKREIYFQPGEREVEEYGQGLGLYLVKTLINRYDGEVWIEDNEPRGTTVKVELPRYEDAD